MATNKTYIQNIIAANDDNSLAIFVGAGISKTSDTKSFKLPLWSDLIEKFKKELNVLSETDYLKIAQLYYLAFGEFAYYKKIKKYFPDYITPSNIHKLIFEINPHIIITTNWDNILERAIEENAYIYDLVCSDKDLVKSTLQNKLIKMHGDFKNHNIVFKEDDYINYQHNFPLIENYVKSILSTHTVLFLGYSYSDMDLKQIVKWIQNHSSVRPPMYLIACENNPNQIKYLENHGITTIVIEDINDKIDKENGVDDYYKKMFTFLLTIKNQDEINIIENQDETIDYVLNKLEKLNELDGILIEQIQNVLTNCRYLFDADSKPILEFHNELLTYDYNKITRNVYLEFVNILNDIDKGEKPTPKIIKIFDILAKAGIKGIVTSKEDITSLAKEYIPFANYIKVDDTEKYFDFDFNGLTKSGSELNEIFELAFKHYNLDNLEESFALMEEAISICLKRRNYTWLFIAMFNRNVLLKKLKHDFNNRDRYKDCEPYDLKEKFYTLTKDLKLALEPIYDFVNFSFLYRYEYDISTELNKKEKEKKTIESGGMVLNSDIFKFSAKHENLVNFVLKNKIMIEDYTEYRAINENFVKIALIRQIEEKNITLTKTELYSCVKYIDYKELLPLLNEYYNKDSAKKGKFQILNELKEWMINCVFENVTSQYVNSKKLSYRFHGYIENIIFLLSLTKLSHTESDKIFQLIENIVKNGRNSIDIFKSINLFLYIQHILYNLEIDKKILINLIETIINKLVYGKFNMNEYFALTHNELSNLYGYADIKNVILENENLIDKLLHEISGYELSDKIDITQNFILNLYGLSNDNIKAKIKEFALSIKLEDEKELHKKIIYELTLVIYDFTDMSENIITDLNNYLEQFKSGKSFSSILYVLDGQIDFLIKNKNIDSLNTISATLKEAINNYKAYRATERWAIL